MSVRPPSGARPEALGERALVVGAGLSGRAVARFLAGRGVRVRACDLRPAALLADARKELPEGTEAVFGGYDERALEGCDAVYASPGVAWDSDLLKTARSRGIPVSSELDLFFRLCPAPIVGVTGTNGKTTTATLIGRVLAKGARPVMVGGNIGQTVIDRLDELTCDHWVVLEASSFQLESCAAPRPRIGLILNLSPDHLDRHRDMAAYVAAKARLIRFLDPGDHALLNGLDAGCRELAALTAARVVWFDEHRPAPPLRLPGSHNRLNALAAAAVGRIAGLDEGAIEAAIGSFEGVEHRLEPVGEALGVRWYNDSKATNPDAGVVALMAFKGTPVVLIAGGQRGGFELDTWLAAVRARTAAAVLIGASADSLAGSLRGHPVRRARSIEEAVEVAAGLAAPGSVVLLSPAHKSYDMFSGYEARGRRFKAAARALMGRAG